MELSAYWEVASRAATQEFSEPATGPYPEPDLTSSYHPILFL
jgi:hypothetical protein